MKRHPNADRFLVDHVVELESFFDRSVMSGMSYGLEKACLAVTEGSLLGHRVGRNGLRVQPDKTRAVTAFPPLRERLHVQQFLGCTNFLRFYTPPQYSHCAKVLGEYVKGTRAFPPEGLGPSS